MYSKSLCLTDLDVKTILLSTPFSDGLHDKKTASVGYTFSTARQKAFRVPVTCPTIACEILLLLRKAFISSFTRLLSLLQSKQRQAFLFCGGSNTMIEMYKFVTEKCI